jgi:nucleotide-binding universal stress UspA family protein
MNPSNVVVVGVDGSPPSVQALRYAISEANRRAATVRVVSAFEPPEYWAVVYGAPVAVSSAQIAGDIRTETEALVQKALAADLLPPKVQVEVVPGSAERALIDASRDADVLVVGHRGRGGFASMMLGSVSLHCVLHARCPVVVVRPSSGGGTEVVGAGTSAAASATDG